MSITELENTTRNCVGARLQVLPAEEALHKVLAGRFTLISFYNYIAILIASRYTDDQGNTPFYISKKGFSIFAFFGWGFR